MNRKLLGLFSGTHLTFIICAALLVPGALFAQATFTKVAITDPNTGSLASVDPMQRLRIYDNVAGYTKNPKLAVNIVDYANPNAGYHAIYAVPSGQVLLLKSLTWSYFGATDAANSYYYLYDANTNGLMNFEGMHVAGTRSATFEAPIIVRAGKLNSYFGGSSGSGSVTYLQGYLVPADAVPAPSSAEASQQFVTNGSPSGSRPPQ